MVRVQACGRMLVCVCLEICFVLLIAGKLSAVLAKQWSEVTAEVAKNRSRLSRSLSLSLWLSLSLPLP